MTVQLGLLLALGCAFATNLAFLWKHRGAVEAPDIDIRHPLAAPAGLFRSKWWTIGFAVALVAWVLHVAALALAPISLVQAVISGGLVFLAVLADRWFGFELGKREWMGVGAHGRRARLPRPHRADRLRRLALELLHLRDDRLRGRDDPARGAAAAVAPRRAACATATA